MDFIYRILLKIDPITITFVCTLGPTEGVGIFIEMDLGLKWGYGGVGELSGFSMVVLLVLLEGCNGDFGNKDINGTKRKGPLCPWTKRIILGTFCH